MKVLVICLTLMGSSYAASGDYSYNDQESWPGVCTTGQQQSPIDVNEIVDTVYYHESLPAFGSGESVRATIDSTADMTMKFNIAAANADENTVIKMPYNWPVGHTKGLNMLQFHFHWGSDNTNGAEHHLFGKQYQGEIHLVTRNLDQDDSTKDDYYAVFGLFLEEVDEIEEDAPGNFVGLISSTQEGVVDINKLYQKSITSVYTYEGSLTTPACDEHVFWQVFETPVQVTSEVMDTLRTYTGHANYRKPQTLNGRKITHRLLKQLFDSPETPDDVSSAVEGEWNTSTAIVSTFSIALCVGTAVLVKW